MRILYNGKTATEHLRSGTLLAPGENDVPDSVATEMLAAGLVSEPATSPAVAATPPPESASGTPARRRNRSDERAEARS